MRGLQSLDELISRKAGEFVGMFKDDPMIEDWKKSNGPTCHEVK